jgi:hypothetical protein
MTRSHDPFPFRRVLSLAPLIDYWGEMSRNGSAVQAELASQLLARVEKAPELLGSIHDAAALEPHRDLVHALMTAIFPPAAEDETLGAALPPFDLRPFYQTRAFERDGLFDAMRAHLLQDSLVQGRAIVAYHYIFAQLFGNESVDVHIAFPFVAPDPNTGLERYFNLTIEPHFVRVVETAPRPELSQAQIQRLLNDRHNLARCLELLPPDGFEFHGFVIFNVQDVTAQHVKAALTSDLLRTDAMTTPEKIDGLQARLRSLLRKPELQLGVIAIERDDADAMTGGHAIGRSLLLSAETAPECPDRARSYYTRVLETRAPVFVRDLGCCAVETGYETHVRQLGVRNLLLAPLQVDDRVIGVLELASPNPGDLHALNTLQLREVVDLFAIALKRLLDERETRVQAIIKQQYTAIHPAVEWRFRDAARNYLGRLDTGERGEPEPIVFSDVYPLYGLSDVRGSSDHRNTAIQADLTEQLELAHDVVAAAMHERPLPVLAELDYRIAVQLDAIRTALRSGDEIRVLDFLRSELAEVFDQLTDFGAATGRALERYRSALDPEIGFLYRQRRRFEDSMTLINETISAVIEREQQQAQAMFPHYFEKFETDGVDYNIYVGASLVRDQVFRPIQLRNLRIWQLMLMCRITWELQRVTPLLEVPLDVAHLILAQSAPLSIRFRADEKKFDVDGAYNIRYEIVKKRIDKALVRGTRQQLTQPGRIAIVFSQPREASEYGQYFAFLHASGYLEGAVEELELEDLQGAHGLQALRVTVAPQPPRPAAIQLDGIAAFERTPALVAVQRQS